jgi:hypothetical protein
VLWFVRILKEIRREVHCIHEDVQRILRLLALRRIDFIQSEGSEMITGIVAGSTGSFVALLRPSNGAQAPGTVPAWTSSDASVSLAPSADGLSVVASVPTGFTAASFDLTLTAVSSDAVIGTLTATHTIPVTQPPPPPLSAIDFDQTA